MRKNRVEIIATLALILACLFFYYGKIILSPNSYLTTQSSDGIKAYAVFAGHIKNDTDYTNYRNMNYPYGQTHIFTDGQTVVANTFRFLSRYIPFFETHDIALYNLMMIFSYAGCAFFLCLILQRLRLPSLFVVLGSIGITLLSPQIFRMGGHLTLSYAVFFPLSWWLFIRFFESGRKNLFSTLIILNSTIWFFIHPYYVMMNTVFYLGYYLVLLAQEGKGFFRNTPRMIHSFLQLSMPLILTRCYILMSDHHTMRSEFPFGFWSYYAKLNTVFAPLNKPFAAIFQRAFHYTVENQNWEGWAYIGLFGVCMFLYSIFRVVRYLFRKQIYKIVCPVVPITLKTAVWSSVLALLFSMCMPFRLFIDFLYEQFGFIQQFRSLGRFAWIFYYVFTVYTVYITYLVYRKWKMKNRRFAANVLVTIMFSLFFIESYAYHKQNAQTIEATPNVFNYSLANADTRAIVEKIAGIRQDYQCIIPFPYYNVGNENFSTWTSDKILSNSFIISHFANMPLFSNSAARSPINEGKRSMQFFTPPVISKEIEKDLPNKKPFLILCDNEDPIREEKYWLQNATEIYKNGSFSLYALPYEKVFADISESEIKTFETIKERLQRYHGLLVSAIPDTIVYLNFDQQTSPQVFRGRGALNGVKENIVYAFERRKCFLRKDQKYILSFWYYNKGELRNQISCILEECDANGYNCKWEIGLNPAKSTRIIGDWSLVEQEFRIHQTTEQISLFFQGYEHSKQEFYADDLMIRPAGIRVYYDTDPQSPHYKEDLVRNFCMTNDVSNEDLRLLRIQDIMNAIRNSPDWLKLVEQKASEKNLPVDSMIYLDAVYVFDEEQKKKTK